MSSTQQPVDEIRIARIKAAIWANESDEGHTYHSVSFCRIYRRPDGEWRSTASFRASDLLLLAKVADRAHSRLMELRSRPAAAPPSDPDEEAA